MAKAKIVALGLLTVVAAATSFKTNAHAEDTTSFSDHKSACQSKADELDPTGTARLVCDGYYSVLKGKNVAGAGDCYYDKKNKVSHNGYTYGVIFLEPASSGTETDGLSDLNLKAYGAVYNCNTTKQDVNATNVHASNSITKIDMELGSKKRPHHRHSPAKRIKKRQQS